MLDNIWNEARSTFGSVNLDTEDQEAVMYKGIKVIKRESDIKIFSTETDFYEDITDSFVKDSFAIGVKTYLKDKYLRFLDRIESLIQEEINGSKNHKRFDYLKGLRNEYLNKYNEINS